MTKGLGGLGGNAGAMAAGAFAAAVLALGAWIGSTRNAPPPADATTPSAALQPVDDSTAAPTGDTTKAPEPGQTSPTEPVQDSAEPAPEAGETALATDTPEAEPGPIPPAFDEVRRESDGMTVIAGRATPGAMVKILQDGNEIARVLADGVGKFATLTMIAPDGRGHVLSLEQDTGEGPLASLDEILLAPLAPVIADAGAFAEDGSEAEAAPEAGDTGAADPQVVADTADMADGATSDSATAEATEAETAPAAAPETAEGEPESGALTEAAATSPEQTAMASAGATAQPDAIVEGASNAPAATQETTDTAVAAADPVADPAAAPVAVLKSTAEGVERMDTAAPGLMDRVALDTIGYSDTGEVQLSGRAQALARQVRVYLDNRAIVSLPVDPDGRWRGDLPAVDAGVYTLRLDELSEDGSVISRVETPFKRESATALTEATQGEGGPLKAVTVQKGDTLWAISRERYGDPLLYVRVFEANANSIRDPDLIYPGQVFDLPE